LLSTDTVAFGGSLAKLPVAPLLEQVLGQQVTRRENRPISEDDRVVELLPAAIELEGTVGARSAHDEPGLEILPHTGEGRSGQGAEPDEHAPGDHSQGPIDVRATGQSAGAGRQLGRSPTAVSRTVAFLERHLGVQLLHRAAANPVEDSAMLISVTLAVGPFG
jgi:hypothetical protein